MQKLKFTAKGISYIENVDYWEFVRATLNPDPICGECLRPIANEKFVFIPILNEVYCQKCAEEILMQMKWYEEDKEIHDARTQYWSKALGINIGGGELNAKTDYQPDTC